MFGLIGNLIKLGIFIFVVIFVIGIINTVDFNKMNEFDNQSIGNKSLSFCEKLNKDFPTCNCVINPNLNSDEKYLKIYDKDANINNVNDAKDLYFEWYVKYLKRLNISRIDIDLNNIICDELGEGYYSCGYEDEVIMITKNSEVYRYECGV